MARYVKSVLFDISANKIQSGAGTFMCSLIHTQFLLFQNKQELHTTMKTVLNLSPSKAFPLLSYVLPSPSISFIPCTFLSCQDRDE